MAQTVSELWKTLWRTRGTRREYRFNIAGTWYGEENEVTHSVDNGLYEEFGIGNAACASLSMGLYADTIPRAAEIHRQVRLVNGGQASEWLPQGTFFANHRYADDGYWTIEAFDAMRKADVVWEPDQSLQFPMSHPAAVAEFARIMGVEIDPRTKLNSEYTISYPANDMTIRDELRNIAGCHGGNFIMTADGKLLLRYLGEEPDETSLLVTEHGDAIVFGQGDKAVRILVG